MNHCNAKATAEKTADIHAEHILALFHAGLKNGLLIPVDQMGVIYDYSRGAGDIAASTAVDHIRGW